MNVDAPSPDPQMGEASKEAIQLGRDQWETQKGYLEKYSPLFEQQMQLSLDAQAKNNLRSDQAWEQYQKETVPINSKIAADALAYNTEERRDKAALDAQAGVSQTFDTARQGLNETLQSNGVDLSSGKGLALARQLATSEARTKAGAAAGARTQVEDTGRAMLADASNVGRGLVATGAGAGQVAMGAGNNATGQVQGLSGLSANGLNSALAGYSTGIQGLGSYNQLQMQNAGQNQQFIGDILGAAGMAYGMRSSEKVKDMGGEVDGEEAVGLISASPAKHWKYKPGEGDGSTQPRLGPTAESLAGTRVSDGKTIDIPSMLGLHHAGLRKVIQDVERLEAALEKGKKSGAKPGLASAKGRAKQMAEEC